MIKYESHSETETESIAMDLAAKLNLKSIVVLSGDLGAGKTVFMKGIAKYFNVEKLVSSPTFTIVNEYKTDKGFNIYHFDVYRIPDSNNFTGSIGTDYFNSGLCIIEWGEKIKDILPEETIYVNILKTSDEATREITIDGGDF